MSNLLLDAKLNQASYDNAYKNGNTGSPVAGWQAIQVKGWDATKQLTTNFSAQLFKGPDGTYKIAYRGTSDWGPGDRDTNFSFVDGTWAPEMTDSIRFTQQAIQAIMTETGKGYDYARGLLSVTGHSQGGFEAELNAKFFGLSGSSLDGPGTSAQVGTRAWNQLKSEIIRQQPDLQVNYAVTDFLARRYTNLVGGLGQHVAGVVTNDANLFLAGGNVPWVLGRMAGAGGSVALQAFLFHKISNIIDLEAARAKSPLLRWISEADDPLSPVSTQPQAVAATISGELNQAIVTANELPPLDFNALQARADQIAAFLQAHPGEIQYRINKGTVLIEANGDVLLLRQDGSGERWSQDGLGGFSQETLGTGGAVTDAMTTTPISDTEALVTLTQNGHTSSTVALSNNSAGLDIQERDASGNLLTSGKLHELGTNDGGEPFYGLDQTRYAGGQVQSTSITTLTPAGQLQMTVERQIDGHAVKIEFVEDEWGDMKAAKVLSVDGQAAQTNAFAQLLDSQGYDAWGFADGVSSKAGGAALTDLYHANDPLKPSGLQTLVTALTHTADALSLLAAIQSGQPLPILASGLRLASSIPGAANDAAAAGFNLSGAANAVSGVLSLMSLDQALKNGDTLGAVTAGATALSFASKAYIDFASSGASGLATAAGIDSFLNGTPATPTVPGTPGVLPYLNIVNSLAHGDYVGAAIYTISLSFPPLGIAYTVFNLISSLFGGDDDVPQPWASGRWGWNAQGQLVPQVSGGDGGEATLNGLMGQLQGILGQLASQSEGGNSGGLGLIPERLPGLSFQNNTFHLSDLDYASGAEALPQIRYTPAGQPFDAPAGSDEGYWSLSERFVRVALEHGAIAPQWEADTARLQSANRLNDAGLSEEDRAAKAGKLVAPASGASQTFRPVVLDLDGDGLALTDQAHSGVAFDVDDSGFLKATSWLANEGAGSDGFLWLDRNWNGAIDGCGELFSNAKVQAGSRGVPSLDWVDANGDGKLTAADPVWNQLKVWKDSNGNGLGEAGEVWALSGLCLLADRQKNPLSPHSCPKWVANDPEHRAAA
ncbi:MAG: hypothetical protein PHD37_18530 [Gallionellaceae bacterium]|nr:hypothetical protein [Gallionellaceae bacterium]